MKSIIFIGLAIGMLFWPSLARAQLVGTVSPVKLEGNKAVVKIAFKNELANTVESVRASVFLLNDDKKTVAQATHWVIGGGRDKPGLASGATNTYYFVVTTDKPFTSRNLTAKVNVDRVVLRGDKLADVAKEVKVQSADK